MSKKRSQVSFPQKRTDFVKGKPSKKVSDILARYYVTLHAQLCKGKRGNFMSMSYEDIFHNAVIATIQDEKAAGLETDEEILEYFKRKLAIVEKQIILDNKTINTNYDANHQ